MSPQRARAAEASSTQPKYQRNELVQPFLKWAGGKRQLLPELRKFVPKKFGRYFEPFIGAGAVLFDLQPSKATINDANLELIKCYKAIRENPEALIAITQKYRYDKDEFYRLRALDREPDFSKRSDLERASRIIYLNKTCFNGLFRVNSQGQFNVPFGDYTNPRIIEPAVIRAVSRYLNSAEVQILQGDFECAVKAAKKGDFVYFDPPYDPLSDTSSFTGYSLDSFDRKQQERLRNLCVELDDRGCQVLASNSATPFIREIYGSVGRFSIIEVEANRNINSVGTGRKKINELLIFNKYDVKKAKE